MLVIYFLCVFTIALTLGIQIHATGHNSLLNKHIKVGASPFNPLFIFYCNEKKMVGRDECTDNMTTYGGALWDLLILIKQARNVTFSIVRPPTYSWGYCYGVNNCTATGHNSLLNKHIKVAASPFNPLFIFYCNEKKMVGRDECSNNMTTYSGALWDLLKLVKLARNVTFEILRPPSPPTWGYCYGENNCTGMIGMVNRREVDFAIGILCAV